MTLYKLQFLALTACFALQTCMILADPNKVANSLSDIDQSKYDTKEVNHIENQTKATAGDTTHRQPAKTQKPQFSKMKSYEEEGKPPANMLDFIDNNLKKVVIGGIAVLALMIIILVCCCVCCAATVCNRVTKKRDTDWKQKINVAEMEEYLQHFHSVSDLNKNPNVRSPAVLWQSPYSETPS